MPRGTVWTIWVGPSLKRPGGYESTWLVCRQTTEMNPERRSGKATDNAAHQAVSSWRTTNSPVFVPDMAQFEDFRFERVERMRFGGFHRVRQAILGLVLRQEPTPLISHPSPIKFVLEDGGGLVIHRNKKLGKNEMAHFRAKHRRLLYLPS